MDLQNCLSCILDRLSNLNIQKSSTCRLTVNKVLLVHPTLDDRYS